jgi:hypothetical protein
MTACQEMMGACLETKEPTSVEREFESEHPEVPKEGEAVNSFGALKMQHGDRHLAVRRGEKQEKQTQGNGGSRKKLATTCRGMTHNAIPATCKGHGRQGQGKDNAVQETSKR